jgi:hypothetical protein
MIRSFPIFMRPLSVIILLLTGAFNASSQDADTIQANEKRLRNFVLSAGVGYSATLTGLYQLWYKNSPHQSFRFFNDNREWKQVDKLGHFYSSYYFSYGTSRALRWCNVPVRKSDFLGALTGFLVLVPVEIFDGYSAAYGASAGDLIADAAGSTFFFGQQLLWNEQRLYPKFSFQQTGYSKLRPDVLGENMVSEIFKDYNGQTYWITADMDRFIRFPRWLDVAAGYGAHGMYYARDRENKAVGFHPYRQYYLSFDLDLHTIRTRSKLIKALIFVASTIKFPAPALELSRGKLRLHALHF